MTGVQTCALPIYMKRIFITLICFVVFVLNFKYAYGQDEVIKIDNKGFTIPQINGCIEITNLSEKWKQYVNNFKSDKNMIILAFYISNNDYKRISQSDIFNFNDTYYVISTYKSYLKISDSEFEKIILTMSDRNNVLDNKTIVEINKDISLKDDLIKKFFNDTRKLDFDNSICIGSFRSSKEDVFTIFSSKVKANNNNQLNDYLLLMSMGLMYINESVIVFSIHSDYSDENDLITIKNKSQELINNFHTKNPAQIKESKFHNIKKTFFYLLIILLIYPIFQTLKSRIKH